MTHTRLRSTNHHPRRHLGPAAALSAGALAALLALGACGTDTPRPGDAPTDPTAARTTGAPTTTTVASGLALHSGWAKAGSGMTAVFGTVRNGTDRPVTILGGSSPAATSVEVHTMARQADGSTRMTRKEGGLVIAPGAAVELAPGGDHIMLLGLHSALGNGEEVTVTLETAEGPTIEWTVPVRSFAGAAESYTPETGAPHATGDH